MAAPPHPHLLHNDQFNIDTDWDAWNHPVASVIDWVPPVDLCTPQVWQGLNGYNRYIIFMRERLCAGQPIVTLHDSENPANPARFRRLPPVGNHYRTFDLRLGAAADKVITIRIRWEDIYLLGYMNGYGEWFCFNDCAGYFVGENATRLRYEGTYRQIQKFTKRQAETIEFGKEAFNHAIRCLWKLRAVQIDDTSMARGLEVTISMVCETIRFVHLSDIFGKATDESISFPMAELDHFATMWSKLSTDINNHRVNFTIIPHRQGLKRVVTVADARTAIAVLLA